MPFEGFFQTLPEVTTKDKHGGNHTDSGKYLNGDIDRNLLAEVKTEQLGRYIRRFPKKITPHHNQVQQHVEQDGAEQQGHAEPVPRLADRARREFEPTEGALFHRLETLLA